MMPTDTRPVHTARPQRTRARLILVGLGVLLVAGLWRPLPRHGTTAPSERTDSALFGAVIARVAQGQPYYTAMGTELRHRGYPSASVFNWRMPTLIVGLAKAPLAMRILLACLAVGAIAGTVNLFSRSAPEIMLLTLLAVVGATASTFAPLAVVLSEAWAGVCVVVSGLLYARGRPAAGASFGLAALFLRELAGPYAAVCCWIAFREGRRREVAIWVAGGLAWCAFYLIHANAASQSMRPDDLAHPSWVQFGGPRFVLATIGFGGWLYVLPTWVAAVAGTLLVSSLWAPIKALHIKAATITYMVVFMIVGQSFNQAWGLLTAPLWAIGYGLGLSGLFALLQEARGARTPSRNST
jgi:hypothetical protein